MADPVSLTGISMAAQAGGGILGAFGAAQSGKAQQSQLLYQAGIAQLRQKIALQNRDYELQTGETEAEQYGFKSRFEAGRIRAAQGASGIDVGGGSAVAVRAGQRMISDFDMATIRNNAARRAYGYESEAATDEAQAGLYTTAASDVGRATKFNIASSLISGAAGVSSKWLQASQYGIL